ncbi:MAG: hypothetical protein ACRDOY_10740 [Nocardioidaceae bacterium]
MRGNGLTADDYEWLVELERSVAADALLALRDAGVAAYAVLPREERPEDELPQDELPDSPLPEDEDLPQATIFADRTALARARAVLREVAPDAVAAAAQPVDEQAWAQIVAGFTVTAREPDGPRTPPRGDEFGDRRSGDPFDTATPSGAMLPPDHDDRDGRSHRDDTEDHFVPDPLPPPPELDPVARMAWAGVFGGPLMLLVATLVSWSPPRGLVLLCVLGFIGGTVTLIVRMRDRPPTDDGPDDGAVI